MLICWILFNILREIPKSTYCAVTVATIDGTSGVNRHPVLNLTKARERLHAHDNYTHLQIDDDVSWKQSHLRLLPRQLWLARLHVVVRAEDGLSKGNSSFLVSRDITVHDTKNLISEHYGIPLSRIHLNDHSPRPSQAQMPTNRSVFYGPLFQEGTETSSRTLQLTVLPVDERLEALFKMVSLDSVKERDEIMHRSLTARMARHCPGGHALKTSITGENCQEYPSLECAKCFRLISQSRGASSNGRAFTFSACCSCDYALCCFCLEDDQGRPAVDPDHVYEALQTMAIELAKSRAEIATWFGGKGHMCGIPAVTTDHELGPKAYQVNKFGRSNLPDNHATKVHGRKLVVHQGARLRVFLSQELRSILTQQECATLEVDEVRASGATCGDICGFRGALSKWSRSPLWPKINAHFQNRFPHYKTWDGKQPEAYIKMRLLNYFVDDVVFEVDGAIDDGDY